MLGEENSRVCARALVGALLVATAASCHWVFPHDPHEGDSRPRDSRVVELAVLDSLALDGRRADDHDAWRPADRAPEAASCAGCVIEDICHAKGGTHPGQPCFVCEPAFSTILWAPAPGCVVTLAGDPKQPGGFANGASSSARFNEPHGVALDGSGRVYVADTVNNRIRVIEHGLVITLAGDGIPGLLNGPAAKARFNQPKGIAVLGAKIYVADTENHCVRVIENGSVSTLAGDGTPGMVDGLAEKARFHEPRGVAVDSSGKLAVADSYNHRVRLIGSGQVNTLAGSSAGFAEGSALAAKLYNPRGLAIGAASTIDIADANNHRIRRFSGGNVNTLAGTGLAGFLDGPLGSARFNTPSALVLASGTLHVADSSNHRIRSIAGGMVATLAGDGTSGHQDGPLPGRFGYPRGIAVDAAGRIYVADLENHCIRVILP